MPLVTAQDFPALFATADHSGLAQGVYQGLRGLGQQRERTRLEQIEKDRIKLMSAADSAGQIYDMAGANLEGDARKAAYFKQRNAIASLAAQAQKNGDKDVAEYWTKILEAETPDQLNVKLAKLATDGLSASGKIGEVLEKRAIARTPGAAKPVNSRSYAPVTLVNPSTKEKLLVSPTVDPVSGGARLEPYDIPEGYEIATETPEEKRQAELLANLDELTKSLKTRAELEPEITARNRLVEDAAKKAEQLFEATDGIYSSISTLQDARQAVLDGAGSGPIERLWPSFRAASVRLDNIRGRAGLDIVSATTFGALSKGELDLSKDVALPTGLDGPDLVAWLDDRIAAQQAKAEYLQRQAVFLSETNAEGKQNTRADWVKSEKAALQSAMDWFATTQGMEKITDADIVETMKETKMTRSEVLREIRRRYEVGGG